MSRTDDRDFTLGHPTEILAILERLVHERALATVEFDGGRTIVSCVLAVQRDAKTLAFDLARDTEANGALFASNAIAFVTELDRIHVAFETGAPWPTTVVDGPAAGAALPTAITRLQRREWFRAELPVRPPIRCTVLDGHGNASPAQAVDLSGGGAAVIVDDPLPAACGSDHELILSLPDVGHVALEATLRTVRPSIRAADGGPKLRLGFRFDDAPPKTVRRILQYVQRLEVTQLRVLRLRER